VFHSPQESGQEKGNAILRKIFGVEKRRILVDSEVPILTFIIHYRLLI